MKNRIMFGVYLMYAWRKARSPFVAETLSFCLLALMISLSVSVPHIISNMKASGNLYQYFIVAFSHTNLLVQSALILSGFAAIFFVKNLSARTVFKQRFA